MFAIFAQLYKPKSLIVGTTRPRHFAPVKQLPQLVKKSSAKITKRIVNKNELI